MHGAHWFLLGDHAQLPAHRHEYFEAALQKDIDEGATADAMGCAASAEWRRYLKHFAHLMSVGEESKDAPRKTLRVQRRMHPSIGEIVSGFYPAGLVHAPETARDHGIDAAPFKGTSLVWLDTSKLGVDGHEEDGYRNYCEVRALHYFFRNRVGDPPTHEMRVAPLAILSPYTNQVRLLAENLGYGPDVVRTVNTFQGRQAEVVLVSLVRNNASDHPRRAVGFLHDSSLVNVMLSRARRLLVVAGSLDHLERHAGDSFWRRIVDHFRSDRRFVVDVAAEGFRFNRRAP